MKKCKQKTTVYEIKNKKFVKNTIIYQYMLTFLTMT